MNSATLNNIAFCGRTRFLSCNSEGKAKTVSDCPFGTAYFGETRDLSDFVKKHSYPSADIEETIGKVHNNKTYKIYVTDPNEIVSDVIKNSHDYIVYDKEPSFPDYKAFFETEQTNIKKEFQVLFDYYKRLESVCSQLGDIKEKQISDTKQKIANMCYRIFDEGIDLRTQKLELQNKIKAKHTHIQEIEENVTQYKKELIFKRAKLKSNEEKLPKKETTYQKLKEKQIALSSKRNRTPEEVAKVKENIERYKEIISTTKYKINKYTERIEFLEQYIEKAPDRIAQYKDEIKKLESKLSDIKRALFPNFKKLQEFYTIHGIKIIRKI